MVPLFLTCFPPMLFLTVLANRLDANTMPSRPNLCCFCLYIKLLAKLRNR